MLSIANCLQRREHLKFNKIDHCAVGIDAILLITIGVFSVLILSGVLNGPSFAKPLAWTGVGVYSLCLIADVSTYLKVSSDVSAYKKSASNGDTETNIFEKLKEEILNPQVNNRLMGSADKIFENLYLGDCSGFNETYTSIRPSSSRITNINPHKYKTIITLCPLKHIEADESSTGSPYVQADILKQFKENSINWYYFGEQTIYTEIFEILDEAILNNHKTLIHCDQGISKSAQVLADYFVSRCDVTKEQAIQFLKSKRSGVQG